MNRFIKFAIVFTIGIVTGYLLRILYTFIGVYWTPALPTVEESSLVDTQPIRVSEPEILVSGIPDWMLRHGDYMWGER